MLKVRLLDRVNVYEMHLRQLIEELLKDCE